VTAVATPTSRPFKRVNRGWRLLGLSLAGIVGYYLFLQVFIYTGPDAQGVALQQTANALSVGAIYALIALGYTLVYGIIELINFAHGDVFTMGAMLSIVFISGIMGQNGPVTDILFLVVLIGGALLFTMPLTGALNMGIDRLVYRHFRHSPRLAPLIAAIGVSLILQNVILVFAGAGDRISPQIFPLAWRLEIGGASIPWLNFAILGVAIGLMVFLQTFVGRTQTGRAMRAVAQDQDAARLMGADLNRTIAITFLLGGSLAGAAGVVWGLNFGFARFDLGFNAGLKSFTAAVLGGIGSITGAVLGGFLIGFIENLTVAVGANRASDIVVFGVLTLVLIFRPTGLLGSPVGERA
jgi:branched-chain amino acid transport system permease protein